MPASASRRTPLFLALLAAFLPLPALALEAIGPAEPMTPAAAGMTAYGSVALTPEGRRLDLYLSAEAGSPVLFGRMDYAPSWLGPWSWPTAVAVVEGEGIQYPALAMSSYGYYAAAWTVSAADPGAQPGVFVRHMGADGTPRSEAVRVDATAAEQYWFPAVATNSHGTDFLVLWTSVEAGGHAVRARYFDHAMWPQGDELRIDLGGSQAYTPAAVAMSRHGYQGEAVVAWTDVAFSPVAVPGSLYLRSLDRTGQLGAPVAVALQSHGEGTSILHEYPALAMLPDGGVVVAWRELTAYSGDGAWSRILARRFDAQLFPLGEAFAVSGLMPTADGNVAPQVAADADGGFVILWGKREIPEGPLGLQATRFLAHGEAGESFEVQPGDMDQHLLPRLALDADGDLSVAWTRIREDGSVEAVRRRFRSQHPLDLGLDAFAWTTDLSAGQRTDLHLHAINRPLDPPPSFAQGAGVATGVAIEVDLPSGLVLVDVDATSWDCDAADPMRCRYRGVLPPGEVMPLRLQVEAGPVPGPQPVLVTLVSDQHDAQPLDNAAEIALRIIDASPDAFAFDPRSDVTPGSVQVSAPVTLGGFDTPVVVTVSGGEFSLNGAAFTSDWAEAQPGDVLRVRHTAAATFATATETTVWAGDASAEFVSVTEAEDLVPEPFAFAPAEGVARGASVESGEILVQGINGAAPIGIQNGEYSIDGAAYTAAAGSVGPGQRVRVRHTSAAGFAGETRSTLDIGGIAADFVSLTEARDVTPDAFAFVDRSGVSRRDIVYSNTITVIGINDATPVSIAGGGGAYSINGGPWSTSAGKLSPGDSVRLRLTASNRSYTTVSTRLEIGGVSDTWSVTTGR